MEKFNAIIFVYGLISIFGTTIVLLIFCRLRNEYYNKMCNRSLKRLRPYIDYIRFNLSTTPTLLIPCFKLTSYEKKVLHNKIIKLIALVSDEDRNKLIMLCEKMNFIEKDIKLLSSKRSWIKFEGIKRIGEMRVKRAIPTLFEILEKEKDSISIYLISSSILKARRSNEDIYKMIKLVSCKRCSLDIIVDSIKNEIDIDREKLFIDLYNQNDTNMLEVAIKVLDTIGISKFELYLYKLLVSNDNKNLKILVIKTMAKIKSKLLYKNINNYLSDLDTDIRLLAIKLAGELKIKETIPNLSASLKDHNVKIKYESSKSLLKLDLKGFIELCNYVVKNNNEFSKHIVGMIEQNLNIANIKINYKNDLNNYNKKLYIYKKILENNNFNLDIGGYSYSR